MIGYHQLLAFENIPVQRPIGPGELPAIAGEGSELRAKMQNARVNARSFRNAIPANVLKTDGAPKLNSILSVMGILTMTSNDSIVSLGRHVYAHLDGDVNCLFTNQHNGEGIVQVRTPHGRPRFAFIDDLSLTTVGMMMPESCSVGMMSMIRQWRLADRTLQSAPFLLSPDFSMIPPARGRLSLLMKLFDDKYLHLQEALTRPELAPVWINGYDILMYVENTALTAGGNRFHYYWSWQNTLPNTEATRFVIFGWIDGQEVMGVCKVRVKGD